MPTPEKGLVARCGFSVPKLDGKGEKRFEAGDAVPTDALTEKTLGDLKRQGVIAGGDDKKAPELGWAQGRTIVNGIDVEPEEAP